jgi:hypothetical protein
MPLSIGCSNAASAPPSAARACSPLDGNKLVAEGVTVDGLHVVVVQPASDAIDDPHYRAFYGPPERMTERTFGSFWVAGATRGFVFDVESKQVTAVFATERGGPGSTTRLIDADNRSTAMTNVSGDAGAPAGALTFFCF